MRILCINTNYSVTAAHVPCVLLIYIYNVRLFCLGWRTQTPRSEYQKFATRLPSEYLLNGRLQFWTMVKIDMRQINFCGSTRIDLFAIAFNSLLLAHSIVIASNP